MAIAKPAMALVTAIMITMTIAATMTMAAAVAAEAAAAAEPDCPSVDYRPSLRLPALAAGLAARQPVVVVALGSSSTQGWMASDPAHAYPAQLQAMLMRHLPTQAIAVVNRGIGGQDAPEELVRLAADVLAVRPVLVIWQVGANGAIHGADSIGFRHEIDSGVAVLRAHGIDVVLMDNQRSARVLAAPEHEAIERTLAEAAVADGVSLFSRGMLMDAWQAAGAPYAGFLAPDHLHHNDRGYACVAAALGEAIVAAVHPPPMATAATPATPPIPARPSTPLSPSPPSHS